MTISNHRYHSKYVRDDEAMEYGNDHVLWLNRWCVTEYPASKYGVWSWTIAIDYDYKFATFGPKDKGWPGRSK